MNMNKPPMNPRTRPCRAYLGSTTGARRLRRFTLRSVERIPIAGAFRKLAHESGVNDALRNLVVPARCSRLWYSTFISCLLVLIVQAGLAADRKQSTLSQN